MTAMLPTRLIDDIAAAAATLEELYDAGDYQAIAWNLTTITELVRHMRDLLRQTEDYLVDIAPWTGKMLEVDGLPPMELRGGSDRKAWRWDELTPLLIRSVLDPAGTGELPDPQVVEAVEEFARVVSQVAPMTPSNGPRVRALAPIVKAAGHDVDEFCTSTPARQTIQIHEGATR